MNIIENKKGLIFITTLLSLLFVGIGFFAIPQQLPWVGAIHWGFVLIAVIYLIAPAAKQPIQHHSTSYPKQHWLPWLSSIFILEIALLILCHNMMQTLSMLNVTQQSFSPPPQASLSNFFSSYGLFPWALYAILSIRYASQCCNYKKDTYPSTLCLPPSLQQHPLQNTCKAIINNGFQQAYYIALSISIATVIIQVFLTIAPSFQKTLTQVNPATVLMSFSLVLLVNPKRLKKFSYQFKNNTRSILRCLCYFIAIITTLLLSLAYIFHGLSNVSAIQPLSIIHPHNRFPLWQFIPLAWWISLTGLITPTLARLCAGYTVRQSLLAILILPLLLMLTHYATPALPSLPSWLNTLLSLTALFLCVNTLFSNNNRNDAIYCMLTQPDQKKPRNIHPFTQKLLSLSLLMSAFLLPLGAILAVIALLSTSWIVVLALVMSLITLINSHIPLKKSE